MHKRISSQIIQQVPVSGQSTSPIPSNVPNRMYAHLRQQQQSASQSNQRKVIENKFVPRGKIIVNDSTIQKVPLPSTSTSSTGKGPLPQNNQPDSKSQSVNVLPKKGAAHSAVSAFHPIYFALFNWISQFKDNREKKGITISEDSFLLYLPKPNTETDDPKCSQILQLKVTSEIGCLTRQIPQPAQLAHQFATLIINENIFDSLHRPSLERCSWTHYKIGSPTPEMAKSLNIGFTRAGKCYIFRSMNALSAYQCHTRTIPNCTLPATIDKLLDDPKNPITNDSKMRNSDGRSFIVLKQLTDLSIIRTALPTQIGSYFTFIGDIPSSLLENDWALAAYNVSYFPYSETEDTKQPLPIDDQSEPTTVEIDDYANLDSETIEEMTDKLVVEGIKNLKETGRKIMNSIEQGNPDEEAVDHFSFVATRLALFYENYSGIDAKACETGAAYLKKMYSYKEFGPEITTTSEDQYMKTLKDRLIPFFTTALEERKKKNEAKTSTKSENVEVDENDKEEKKEVKQENVSEKDPQDQLTLEKVNELILAEVTKAKNQFSDELQIKNNEITKLTDELQQLKVQMTQVVQKYEAKVDQLEHKLNESDIIITKLTGDNAKLTEVVADLQNTILSHKCPISEDELKVIKDQHLQNMNQISIMKESILDKEQKLKDLTETNQSLIAEIDHLKASNLEPSPDQVLLAEFSQMFTEYESPEIVTNINSLHVGVEKTVLKMLNESSTLGSWMLGLLPILQSNTINVIPSATAEGLNLDIDVLGTIISVTSERSVIKATKEGMEYLILM